MRSIRAAAIALACLVAGGSTAYAQAGSISGVVVKSPNGDPAVAAVVKLLDESPGNAPPGYQLRSTTTAADGSFRFDGVEPGTYYVVANLTGHLPSEYGQRSPTGTGLAFDVGGGQRVNVRLTLWPTGGISGRVFDAEGDAVGRAQVLALRLVYSGGKASMTIAQTVMTNDRGEYRMFWLTPGTYHVAAREWDPSTTAPAVNIGPPRRFSTSEQAVAPLVRSRTLPNGTVVEETYVPVYAPSSRELSLASTIVLGPGDNATNVDVQLNDDHVVAHHVRGTLTRIGNDRLTVLQLVPRITAPFALVAVGIARQDGAFDIGGVAPGSYMLYSSEALIAQPVDVGDADVDVAVVESPLIKLTGRITFDRGLSGDVVTPKASDLQIQMTREPELLGAPQGGPRFNPPPADNGQLNLNSIPPGDYRVAVWPLSNRDDIGPGGRKPAESYANAYVKSIRLGDVDVATDSLHLWSAAQPSLEIVIGLNGAQVEGTVVSNRGEPLPNVIVVGLPDGSNKGRRELTRQTKTDGRGHFALQGLAPGEYSFYAWDDVERGAWADAEFMRGVEGRGRFVRLREGKNEPLELNSLAVR
jgi:hypothetical protein